MGFQGPRGTVRILSQPLIDGADTTITKTVQKRKSPGLPWFIKSFFDYLGNPFIFLAYLFTFSDSTISDKWKPFTRIEPNHLKMNIWMYLAITLPTYVAWCVFELMLMSHIFSHFSPEKFLESTVPISICYFVASVPGILNILFFATEMGMEEHELGVTFAPLLFFTSLVYFMLW
eukprot:CAMPEP_0185730370 /NCGR_PEP_ID=MMETSP1171-20130828/9712_1 /TAXON_ID=374046 /ORGANISM="Helicotheca tamensis, Strain CCMP826" /LENGTH=174 /DNA_ID=CAMNT_0028399401 /DNA_START=150 /DNA_END=671 /DNA_ORIENTATION=-